MPSTETLTVRVTGQFAASLQATVGIQTIVDTFAQPIQLTLNNGVGDGNANQIFSEQRDLPAGTDVIYNLVTMNGSNDGAGNPLALANVKYLGVWNLNGTETNDLIVGGAPAGARGWTNASTGTTSLNGTSFCMLGDPGPAGFPVPAGNGNNLFRINNTSSALVTYRFIVVGATS